MLPLSLSGSLPPISTSAPRPPIRVVGASSGPIELSAATLTASSLSLVLTRIAVTPFEAHMPTPLIRSQKPLAGVIPAPVSVNEITFCPSSTPWDTRRSLFSPWSAL